MNNRIYSLEPCLLFCTLPFAEMNSRSPSSALLPFLFLEEGSPIKTDYRKKGTLIITTLLEDLVFVLVLLVLKESITAGKMCFLFFFFGGRKSKWKYCNVGASRITCPPQAIVGAPKETAGKPCWANLACVMVSGLTVI